MPFCARKVSVGKLCDDENLVVFDKYCYAVFKGKLECKGTEIHAQNRDLKTGLYPVTLTTSKSRDCRTQGLPLGPLHTKTHFCNFTELRDAFLPVLYWAQNVCAERNRQTHAYECDTQVPTYTGALARFYVKEGMTNMERWHNKLGHVGSKIIKACDTRSKNSPYPFSV